MAKANCPFPPFCSSCSLYTLLSAILLSVCIFYLGHPHRQQTVLFLNPESDYKRCTKKPALIRLLHRFCFFFCLLAVLHVLPYPAVFCPSSFFGRIDAQIKSAGTGRYSLLATFLAFFIFIGNLGRIPPLPPGFLQRSPVGNLISVLASQVMSNVPAALFAVRLFFNNVPALIVGTNLGGLGTLIASMMASLISYRQIARKLPEQKVGSTFFCSALAKYWFSRQFCLFLRQLSIP